MEIIYLASKMRLNKTTTIAFSGIFLLFLGFLCFSIICPKLEKALIEKATEMSAGTKTFEAWRKIPFPFKLKIYFFNVSNPDQVQAGATPVLKELGPYVYNEYREREILLDNLENDTIVYTQKRVYYFNEEESGCRQEDDLVTIAHIGAINIANKLQEVAPMALPLLNEALPGMFPKISNVFTTDKVRNILFDGMRILCSDDDAETICDGIKSKIPPSIRLADNNIDLQLSIFHSINDTFDGPYEIQKGTKSGSKGKLISFKNKPTLAQWSGPCNTIQGTDLTLNPNLWKPPKEIFFFVGDFCRSFSADFRAELAYSGLQTYQFQSLDMFGLGHGRCFCPGNGSGCANDGFLDLAPCTHSSIILSQPHFLGAGSGFPKLARGLSPEPDKHGTFVLLEPKTGLSLVVKTRFQMSVDLKKIEELDLFANVSEGILPFLWLEECAVVPEHLIQEIKESFGKLQVLTYLNYFLIVSGSVLLCVGIMLAMIKDRVICGKFFKNNTISSNFEAGRVGDIIGRLQKSNKSGNIREMQIFTN